MRGCGHCSGQYFLLKLNYFIVFYRRQRRSLSSRTHKSRSSTPRRRKSRSPTPKRTKRQRKRSTSSSPLSASPSIRTGTKEMKDASEKLKTEEEEKKRYNYHNFILPLLCSPLYLICFNVVMCSVLRFGLSYNLSNIISTC